MTIGLALGCGAARGFAHIGVLRTLLANGIRPDVITGTSIGAVIAGVYAAGRLDAFEAWARELTRGRVLGYLDFSFSGSGLIGGSRLADDLVRELGDVRFDELPVRVAAIATEVGTGHEIWLTRGRLADAMYASYALPGIFPPYRIGGRWLMDGALVNPVPVSAARSLGARLVIAVNLNADNFGRGTVIQNHGPDFDEGLQPSTEPPPESLRGKAEQLFKRRFFGSPGKPGLSTVMVDAFNIVQDRITRTRLAADPPDTLIAPRLARFGVFDFHRADEAIKLGVEATEKALENIAEAMQALA
ncbi:MAG: patatin-like phospholipase family protein [Xanthobacteraceae bacterium]